MQLGTPVELALALIRTDARAQPREALSTDVIEAYAADMAAGQAFPPLVVFGDGQDYWLADGFHRHAAAQGAGFSHFPCDVHQGSLRGAILYSCGANAEHGHRRSNADKRRVIARLLEDDEWSSWSDSEIARHCHVDHKTVAAVRGEQPRDSADDEADDTRTVRRNGATYDMDVGPLRRRRVEPITKLIEEAAELAAGREPGICPACGQPVSGDELIVSLDTNSVSRWGQIIELPPQATEIMHAMKMDYPNATRPTTIQRRIYGAGEWPEDADNVLNVYVSKIRRLVAPLGVTIERYHSRGYRLSLHDEPVISINDR